MLNCKEFVNADEIAKGLSPFQPEKVSIQAGRIMLNRMKDLIDSNADFGFETTLASKSYVHFIKEAQLKGYFVTLVYFWLNSPELAIERVKARVISGGHDVPEAIIRRRYTAGKLNLHKLFLPICDYWMIIDNSEPPFQVIGEGFKNENIVINDSIVYNQIVKL
jgi:predicted ABC-type ATPase